MLEEKSYFETKILDSTKKFENRRKSKLWENNEREMTSFCDQTSFDSYSKSNYSNVYEKSFQYQPEVIIEGVSRRREANARERLRVRNLNSGFAKLRRIIPTVPPNRKPSKVDTLQGAIDYIHQLEVLLEATGGVPDIGLCLTGNMHSHSRQSVTECPFFPLSDLQPRNVARFSIFSERLTEKRKERLKQQHFTEEPVGLQGTDEHSNNLQYSSQENVKNNVYFTNQTNYNYI